MPGYKGHLAGGVITFFLVLLSISHLHAPFCKLIEWLIFALVGSLFPDIDTKSKGQKLFYWLLFPLFACLFICQLYNQLFVLSCISLLPMMVRHRGLFHKFWFIIILTTFFIAILSSLFPAYTSQILLDALFFCAGAFSHLWLDLGFRRMLRL